MPGLQQCMAVYRSTAQLTLPSYPKRHSNISCPATCAGAVNFGVGKGSWQPPWTLCVALPRITIKRVFCRMLHMWSASSETCWQLLYFSVTSVQPLCSHAGFADWSVKLFLWLNDWDYATRHSAHQHPHFQMWLFFFFRNKPLRTVVQHNAPLSVTSIRCPHMLVARGYFNYIVSINSGALCMHSLNEVPDPRFPYWTQHCSTSLCIRNSYYSEELVHLQTTICQSLHLNLN